MAADWRDRPMTPGNWHWSAAGSISAARYQTRDGGTVMAIVCDQRSRRIALQVQAKGGPDVPVVVTTTSLKRLLSGRTESALSGIATVALDPRDPLLDAMVFSRGRFMIEVPGSQGRYLPSWTEMSRVIEDCR